MTMSPPVSAQAIFVERRRLMAAFLGLLSVAVLAVFWLLGGSLAPSARALAERPRVTLPPLAAGEFVYIPNPTSIDHLPTELLVLRKPDGAWRLWQIPTRNGVPVMPDIHWWRAGPACPKFEPDFQQGVIACLSATDSGWDRADFLWDLDGRHLARAYRVDDMLKVEGEVSGTDFVFSAR